MYSYVNTVYTFMLPQNTSDLPHKLWVVTLLQALDAFIKRTPSKKEIKPVIISPYDIALYAYSYYKDLNAIDEHLLPAKDHIYAALMKLIADDALQALTLYNPNQVAKQTVTGYRIIERKNDKVTWVKLYVRMKQV